MQLRHSEKKTSKWLGRGEIPGVPAYGRLTQEDLWFSLLRLDSEILFRKGRGGEGGKEKRKRRGQEGRVKGKERGRQSTH